MSGILHDADYVAARMHLHVASHRAVDESTRSQGRDLTGSRPNELMGALVDVRTRDASEPLDRRRRLPRRAARCVRPPLCLDIDRQRRPLATALAATALAAPLPTTAVAAVQHCRRRRRHRAAVPPPCRF